MSATPTIETSNDNESLTESNSECDASATFDEFDID